VNELFRTDPEIAVTGWACRLPGAASVDDLWSLLSVGRCAVSRIPQDRWSLPRFWHPRRNEPGRSYTWAAGVLDDIWGFDPAMFGISPREAEQMDPQQRLMLELVWEALENAGIVPSALAGKDVGVFVGASSLDYGNLRLFDLPSGDAYTATGNTLSLISNRVSHIYDLRGPSLTVDTACSSSLVALDEAISSLRSGRVDTAIVAGVNLLVGPFNFLSFAQASLLSPTGLCRPFDANADGYVRAEGGVVLVLRTLSRVDPAKDVIHGMIVGSAVNSDGRTVGVSMPSSAAQSALLDRVYHNAAVDPSCLAFVEAHGTGTSVGDPMEATALGNALGRRRPRPLPIGSIKSNLGHLEPASGLAGVLKAMLALKHDVLPASLHVAHPNPKIPFDSLNLAICREPIALPRGGARRYAGINSFGFGGTNAHVLIADAPKSGSTAAPDQRTPQLFLISAQSRPALASLAGRYATRLRQASDQEAGAIPSAAFHRRERLPVRLAVMAQSRPEIIATLNAVAARVGEEAPDALIGTAIDRDARCAFVFSGNGSQWPGMGRIAYAHNEVFRERFDAVDARFARLAGWSLKHELFAADIDRRLKRTSIAQPLLFAIQCAATKALEVRGLTPFVVLGHSVGEVAAAAAAEILPLEDAVRVIHYRSLHQELAQGAGSMAVVFATQESVERLIDKVEGVEVAAFNSPRAFTVSGTRDALHAFASVAALEDIVLHRLDLDYAFHSGHMNAVQAPLARDLDGLAPLSGDLPFISTVTGEVAPGTQLDGGYWWRNVRDPVLFQSAVRKAFDLGARIFIEIGPRNTLQSLIADNLEAGAFAMTGVLDRTDPPEDPFRYAIANAFVRGAKVASNAVVGPDPGAHLRLPEYPWQRQPFRLRRTGEALTFANPNTFHPLIGCRDRADATEWRSVVDLALLPELNDHRVNGQVLLPGAAFVEMALAVARDWLNCPAVAVTDIDIAHAMPFADDTVREVLTRLSPASGVIEILSRTRFSESPWQLHARAKLSRHVEHIPLPETCLHRRGRRIAGAALYELASKTGLQYGPAFRQVEAAELIDQSMILVELVARPETSLYGLDPARLDSCFHGLILLFSGPRAERQGVVHVPVRFGEVRLFCPNVPATRAVISVERCNDRGLLAHFTLLDSADRPIATLSDVRYQSIRSNSRVDLLPNAFVQRTTMAPDLMVGAAEPATLPVILDQTRVLGLSKVAEAPVAEDFVLLEGWATAAALALVRAVSSDDPVVDVGELVSSARLPESARLWFLNLLCALERSKLATRAGEVFTLAADAALPDPKLILASLADHHSDRSAELLLASVFTELPVQIREQSPALLSTTPAAPWISEALDLGGAAVRSASEALVRLVDGARLLRSDCASRILQIGYGPLSYLFASLARTQGAHLTIIEPDQRRIERAKLAFESYDFVSIWPDSAPLPQQSFDLVVSAYAMHRLPPAFATRTEIAKSIALGGLFAAIEPGPSLFRDLVCGLDTGWFAVSVEGLPIGRLQSTEAWCSSLATAGFRELTGAAVSANRDEAVLLLARGGAVDIRPASGQRSICIAHGTAPGTRDIATALATEFASSGHHVSIDKESKFLGRAGEPEHDHVIYLADAPDLSVGAAGWLRERCFGLKQCAERLGGTGATLWVLTVGLRSETGDGSAAVSGYWTFTRTLANEFPTLNVHRIDLMPNLSVAVAATHLKALVLSGTAETEILIGEDGIRVVRTQRLNSVPAIGVDPAAARLERAQGGIERLSWTGVDRTEPAADQIEIAVEATGLNFRDVMFALSLLPEDMLEDGFAGPTMGLECAGRVLRVGSAVRDYRSGDRVVAFAASAFSVYATVPAHTVALIPDHISFEAAATIPVAFSTAYYALESLAHLRRDEWVLIHGGAGGVGLAAIQIARRRGARVIATAGSSGKRALLKVLGADHALDSRSLAFVDEVRRITQTGVDVVLNSLNGEAMERSLAVLKPFGRFVELGKRDYVANTHVGLRPFRHNISYFGVDLDQLLSHRPSDAVKMFRKLMKLFADRVLNPLPYRSFSAGESIDAFRLMLQSGHIGKILIKPPARGEIRRRPAHTFVVDAQRTHLMTGAFGGFGIETARWLANRGARHLVLIGRSGPASAEAKSLLADLDNMGVQVLAAACDVADPSALMGLKTAMGSLPPLGGVIHAAMVLDDRIIVNMTADQLDRVMRPKVIGAENLHALTRDLDLDYFVMFSSITTFLGSPGQGAYVAANGFLEGLARRRCELGLPALAIAWGGISDVGVMKNNRKMTDSAGKIGVRLLAVSEALALMEEALGLMQSDAIDPVLAIAPLDWSAARRRLALLMSPTYRSLGDERRTEDPDSRRIDVAALVAADGVEATARSVTNAIVEEVSRVMRLPKEEVAIFRPLSEAGLDSLMAIELAVNLQDRFGLSGPTSDSPSGLTVAQLAEHIIATVLHGPPSDFERASRSLRGRHLTQPVDADMLSSIAAVLEEKSQGTKGLLQ
jgi:phthiocerol/phenolphthiocerol synthesis type-I polyketide synthase C